MSARRAAAALFAACLLAAAHSVAAGMKTPLRGRILRTAPNAASFDVPAETEAPPAPPAAPSPPSAPTGSSRNNSHPLTAHVEFQEIEDGVERIVRGLVSQALRRLADAVHLPGIYVQRVLALTPEQAAEKRIERRTVLPNPDTAALSEGPLSWL